MTVKEVSPGGEDERRPAKRAITDRQKRARRENGAKSKGPVTEEGKARSRENATKHGGYRKLVTPITRGPLREDPDELSAFYTMMLESLGAETPLEQALAGEVVRLLWRKLRLGHWEAYALSGLSADAEDAQPRHHRFLATMYELASRIIEHPDEEYSTEDLGWGIGMVFNHPDTDDSVWEAVPDDAPPEALRALLERVIAEVWGGDRKAVTAWLETQRQKVDQSATIGDELARENAALKTVSSEFMPRLIAAEAHDDRTFQRALDRYYAVKARGAPSTGDDVADE